MSDQITTAFVNEYSSGIELVAQQLFQMTHNSVTYLGRMSAKKMDQDQIGAVRLQKKNGRHADIPVVETPHKRRWITAERATARDFIDHADKLQMLTDPTNAYTQAFGAAAARYCDKQIIDAALGTNWTGENGDVAVALPASQKIAVGGTGFTFTKLKQGVRMLRQKHAIQKGDELYCYWTARQEEEFINTTEVKSSDFTKQMVIDAGGVDQFYKVKFIQIEDEDETADGRMLPISGTTRSCVLYAKKHLAYADREAPGGRVAWLDEKEAFQVSGYADMGATRLQEVGVVQIDVVESS